MKTIVSLTVLAAAASLASAAGSTFATATPNLGGGVVSGALSGAVDQEVLFARFENQNRSIPNVNVHTVTGMTGGAPFRAEMNAAANGSSTFDSLMRATRSDNSIIATDDDGGPGAFSQIINTVPGDGTINFLVTGYNDSGFTGATGAQGNYDLDVYQRTRVADAVSMQWWRFDSLTVGQFFNAAVIASSTVNYDTYFKVYDSAGNLLGSQDDGGTSPNGFWSVITDANNIVVPGDGVVYLGVTNFNINSAMNPAAANDPNWAGPTGSFDISVTPAPGALALLGLGGLVAGRRRRA